jgi:hypothetical protein
MIYLVKIYKSYGGRSDTGQWSNGYHVTSDNAIDSPLWNDVIGQMVDNERVLSLSTTSFMRALVTPFAENAINAPEKTMRTFELQGIGNINMAAGDHALDLNVCVVIKRQLATGRSGRLFLRGALSEADVEMGANGRFMLSIGSHMRSDFSRGRINDWHLLPAGFKHGIPNEAGLVVQTSREVVKFALGGVTLNRRDHRKAKKSEGTLAAVQNAIDAIAGEMKDLLGGAANVAALASVARLAFTALRTRGLSLIALLPAALRGKLVIPQLLQ